MQTTWRRERRRIGWSVDHRTSIGCTRGPLIIISARVEMDGIITVMIETVAAHHDRQIAI